MHESLMSSQPTGQHAPPPLVMRWIPVRDSRGRTVMESCWVLASKVALATAAPETTHVVHAA